MSKRARSNIMLFMTAFIWGTAFVAQKVGADLGALTFNGIRTFIGGLFLIPVIYILGSVKKKKNVEIEMSQEEKDRYRKMTIIGGIVCGVVLCAASTLQQFGLYFTSAGKTGFITALYTVIVPIISIILGRKIRPIIWLCVAFGAAGLYFLCLKPGEFYFTVGDLFVLACAFLFAVHILVIDYFSPRADGVKMSCIQFLIAGGICMVLMFFFENPQIGVILKYSLPILYAGILSCGVAYTLQIVAQANAEPTQASLILCLESVFSVLGGAVILGERMDPRGYLGCALIFAAVVISNLPSREDKLAVRKQNTLTKGRRK